MKTLQMMNDYIAVVRVGGPKKSDNPLFVMPELQGGNLGVIKYGDVNTDNIYFGKDFQIIQVDGTELLIMSKDNILAFVVEGDDGEGEQSDNP